jgi:glycosyltransferase involved in cell wall biosynthesis
LAPAENIPAGASDAAPTLSVALLHDYRESVSMRLYAERLGSALEELGVHVSRVRQPEVIPPALRRVPLVDKLDSYVGRFAAYPRLARRATADVFHIVDHGQGYLVSSLDPARTVVTCHDVILLAVAAGRIRSDVRPLLATRLLRHSLEATKRARRVIAVSEHTRTDLIELVGVDPSKIVVVYSGLNLTPSPPTGTREETRRRLGLPEGPIVLHVGYNGFYKNISGVLRVVAQVRREGLPVTLVRCGDPFTPRQRALAAELGIDRALVEIGTMAPHELAGLYRAADVLLFPSLYEGFGWPPLEAMASELPVVCSRAGGLGEAVGDAALTCEPDDVSGLADAVGRVLTCAPVRESLKRLGVEQARRFDWSRTAQQVRDVYRAVADA